MANFKPVIAFDDNLSNHLQNTAPTSYAVSKMRAGRTPKDVAGETIKDANAIFRPGLYYLGTGALNLNNEGTESTYPVYLYNLVQDPDESLEGGHALEDETTSWHLNVTMNFRQIIYACTSLVNGVTTRTGTRDAAIASLTAGSYKVIATVQQIESTLKSLSPVTNAYAYVKDIAMWIRYTITNSLVTGTKVTWVPAITWDVWKSITGDSPVTLLTKDTILEPNTRYVSFGQYNLILPNANSCDVGAKVVIDQWSGDSFVRTYDAAGTTLISEMEISPCVANTGMSDMKIHGDPDLATEGVVFTKNANSSWSYTENGVTYTVEQVTLKANSASEDGKVRWAVTFIQDGVKYLKRVTPDDATYPFGASTIYYLTSDTVVQSGKTYYTRSISSGVEVYTPVTLAVGSTIPANTYYEASSSVRWYDVTDRSTIPYTYKEPWQVAQSEIILIGIYTNLSFSITDVSTNVVGAGQYTFEVTFDQTTTSNKVWVLERCSDFESFMNRVTSNIGATVTQHTTLLTEHEGRLDANEQLIQQYRNQYFEKEFPVRVTVENIIYGDNAKVSGEDLIVFKETEFLDRSSLATTSYTVNYFRSRLTPVYTVAKQNGDLHTFYLPTKMQSIVGKKIKFLLEPGAKINVLDDNSTLTPTSYQFEGYTESSTVVSDHPKMSEVIFEVIAYKNQTGTESYAWTYTQRMTGTNNSITTQDITNAVSAHNVDTNAHSGIFLNSAVFSAHCIDSVVHTTAAEKVRWNGIASSGVTSQAATAIASAITSTHNIDTGAHPDKITAGQLADRLLNYVTTSSLATTLQTYVTSVTLDLKLADYMTTAAGTTMSNALTNQINSRVTSSQMVDYVDQRIGSMGSDYITSAALTATLSNYTLKTAFDVVSADVATKTNSAQVSTIVLNLTSSKITSAEVDAKLSSYVTSTALNTALSAYVTSATVSALVSQILDEQLTSRTW